MNNNSKNAALVAFFIFGVAGFYFAPAFVSRLWPPCLLKSATGLHCFGCGGQRAFHVLLHGRWGEALRMNMLVFPVIALGLIVLVCEVTDRPYPSLLKNRNSGIGLLTFVILFTVLRNIPALGVFIAP